MEIKEHIFHDFLDLNPLGMWADPALKKGVCLSISEVVVEVGEALFDYQTVDRSDLIFLSKGSIHSYCQLDHSLQFSCHHSVLLPIPRTRASSMFSASSPASESTVWPPSSTPTAPSTSSGGRISNTF